jgi:hypothetical protein
MNHLSLLHTEHILSSSKVHKNILLLSNDHHMNARNLLENQTYLDLHIMVYKIDKNHSCGFTHQVSKQLILAPTLSMQQEPFLLFPY